MKVLLVTKGDAALRRTWSGVPRIVLDRLRAEGADVVLLNLFDDFWFHALGAVWNRTRDHRRLEFESTRLGGWLMARAVRRAAVRSRCERVVALTFALDARRIPVPVELVHDWTPGYFWKRRDAAELCQLERMRHAASVKCLYPASTRYLRENGVPAEFVGLPVDVPDAVRAAAKRKVRRDPPARFVVFAMPWHRDNLDSALEYLRGVPADWRLDVVGAEGVDTDRVRYHGYLDKDIPAQAEEYWRVLLGADCLLALGAGWPGGSSIAEAKACGCDVRTRDWPDLEGIA